MSVGPQRPKRTCQRMFGARNTFIESFGESSESPQGLFDRDIHSCPGIRVGKLDAVFEDAIATDDEPLPVTPQQWYMPPSCAHMQSELLEFVRDIPAGQASAGTCGNSYTGVQARSFVPNMSLLPALYSSYGANTSTVPGVGNAQSFLAYGTDSFGFLGGERQQSSDSLSVWSGQGVITDSVFGQMCQMRILGPPPPPREPPIISLDSMLRSSCAASELPPVFSPFEQKQFRSDLMSNRISSATYPSAGSAGHAAGTCKPCAFLHTKGCENGLACEFCHLCEAGEKKRRHKDKLTNRKNVRAAREAARRGGC